MRSKTKKSIYVVHPITTSPNPEYINRPQIECGNWWYLIDNVFGDDFEINDSKFCTAFRYFIDNSFQSVQKEILNMRKNDRFYDLWWYSKSLYMAIVLEYPVKASINSLSYTRLWLVNNKGEVIFDKIRDKNNPEFPNQGAK